MTRANNTPGERFQEMVDADLQIVGERRLPEEARQLAMANLLGSLETPYAVSFEMGYAWARQAQLFAITGNEVSEELNRVAIAYRKKARRGIPAGSELVNAVLLMRDVKLIANDDTNPFADANEASAARTQELIKDGVRLSTGEDASQHDLEGAFHAGAAFWAAETQILLDLRHLDRLEQVERWQKQERMPVIGHWLARLRKRRWR